MTVSPLADRGCWEGGSNIDVAENLGGGWR